MERMNYIHKSLIALLTLLCCGLAAGSKALAQTAIQPIAQATIRINVNHPSHPIGSLLYGLMTEEISHSYVSRAIRECTATACGRLEKLEPINAVASADHRV